MSFITDTTAIRTYFAKLGLEPEIADLYLALQAYGAQSISELARHSGVERTRIYRLIDVLKESGLVEVETHYKRSIVKAAPVSNLQILISKKEEELSRLQTELGAIEQLLEKNTPQLPGTKVQFYHGLDGLKQLFWNQTNAKGENLAILYENMQFIAGATFFKRWVRKFNERQIPSRGIISDHFISTQQEWYATRVNERIKDWRARYVPDTIYPITHSTVIYDNVVAYYNWKNGEMFGIEMYNQEIAHAQRHFFEMLWYQSQPVDDLIGPKKPTS